MNILAIDTSGPVAGVSVVSNGAVAYEGAAVNRMTHSVNLMPMVEEALSRAGLQIGDIDLYACVTGPGSFTGVRIGVSAVKGMAHGAGKPCVGIDALEALASGVCVSDALICPIQDARAGQVYGAAFSGGFPPVRELPDMAEKLERFIELALEKANGRKLIFVGDGVKPHKEAITAILGGMAVFAPAHMCFLRSSAVAALADAYSDRAADYLTLMPMYLRAPQAERLRERKEREAREAKRG